jgi:hypothetical protein
MGVMTSLRCDREETLLLVELEAIARLRCLIVVRQFDDDLPDDPPMLEVEAWPELGVRIDGKLTGTSVIPLYVGDNIRVELGSQAATLRYASRARDGGDYLDVITTPAADVRPVAAARFNERTRLVELVEEGRDRPAAVCDLRTGS